MMQIISNRSKQHFWSHPCRPSGRPVVRTGEKLSSVQLGPDGWLDGWWAWTGGQFRTKHHILLGSTCYGRSLTLFRGRPGQRWSGQLPPRESNPRPLDQQTRKNPPSHRRLCLVPSARPGRMCLGRVLGHTAHPPVSPGFGLVWFG